jgi:N-acetylglucosaminyldiphosphoundecaprenol N-acetyl-beta-D-mannosaminyltransferase
LRSIVENGERSAGRGRAPAIGGSGARVDVLGVGVDPVTLDDVLRIVESYVRSGGKKTVGYANVYCVNVAARDPEYREIANACDLVYCDGFGVVLGARILGSRLPGRMTGADWIYDLGRFCRQKGYSLFLMGGRPGVARRAADRLRSLFPGLRIPGTHHGYLAEEARAEEAIRLANRSGADIVLVGMGTPIQEKFIHRYRDRIDAPVCWVVGALFDFVAGEVPRAPKWMLDNGLEWLFRLAYEPRRMWSRYLVGNTLFLCRVATERLRLAVRRRRAE